MKHRVKVQFALDESRILVLGLQVLLGFDLQMFLMPQYDRLEYPERVVMAVTLALLLVALVMVLVPTAHHRIVDRGQDTASLDFATQWAINLALLPMALALAGASYVVGERTAGRSEGAIVAVLTLVGALAGWYLLPFAQRRREPAHEDVMKEISLKDKVAHVLTELRVVLPGTQALLGFQLAAVFQHGFDELPPEAKVVHLVGFAFLSVSVVLLLLPAAYHRIAEHGEPSERLHQVTSVCIVLGMVTLACGIACDIDVVVHRVTARADVAALCAVLWLVVSLGVWIVGMFAVRLLQRRDHGGAVAPAGAPAGS